MLDGYGGRFTVAEVGGADSDREMKLFTAGDTRLDTAYGFDFLYAPALDPATVAAALRQWPGTADEGWPSWAFENHDAPRAVTRWAAPEHRDAFARIKMLLLLCLRGNVFLYQGEELGLTQVDVPLAELQDPEAIANWPRTLSRDGARTPMPWRADEPWAGFSTSKPWLPVGDDHAALAVDRQDGNSASLLHLTRRLVALRRAYPALTCGASRVVAATGSMLAFERHEAGDTLLCVFNLGSGPAAWMPEQPDRWRIVDQVGDVVDWRFGGYAGVVLAG